MQQNPHHFLAGVDEAAPRRALARQVVRLAWPAVAEQLFFGFAQMAVLIIVGALGPEAIAAVGVSTSLQWLFVSAFFALGAGATTLVARSLGAGDVSTAGAATRQAATATASLALTVGGLGWLAAEPLLRLMGLDPPTAALATPYLRLTLLSLVFSSTAMCLGAALRGAGDTRTPMAVNLVATAVNVGLAYLLVGGRLGFPCLGVKGAALSFLGSGILAAVAFLQAMTTGRCGLWVSGWVRYRPDWALLRRLLNVGIPTALEQVAMSVGILAFVRLVTALGVRAYAAHQIAVNLTNLTFPIALGFGLAATALVGQSLGAGKPLLAERYARTAQALAFWLVTATSLSFALFPGFYAGMYTRDPQVISLARVALQIAAVSQPGLSLYVVLAGALRGAGDTRWPLYLTLIAIWGIRFSLGYLGTIVLPGGLGGAWGAVFCDQWLRAFLVNRRFRSRRWQVIRV